MKNNIYIKISVLLFCSSFIFSATIKYLEISKTPSYSREDGFSNSSNQEAILTVENVRIKKITDRHITFIEQRVSSGSVNLGGFFITMSAIISLMNINRERPNSDNMNSEEYFEQMDEFYDESKFFSNIASATLFIGGLSIAAHKMNLFSKTKTIPCKDVIQIIDDRNRLIEFNCNELD